MIVLQEVLEWSRDRPTWQQDALRRLLLNGGLTDDDVHELTDICKCAYGLAEPQEIAPLSKEHVPEKSISGAPVSLVSIRHHRGVNALAQEQTLKFRPNLTVVYGDNAAGKTGYIRILKRACRARGHEQILGNVVSGSTPLSPVVSIRYNVGSESEPRSWIGSGEDELISRVSVFDTQCAAVYLTEKTDVAFRPFGLDLFDKLVKACKAIRAKLEDEKCALAFSVLADVLAQIPKETAVAKLLANINSLTTQESVQTLANLSPKEEARFALLEKSLIDLQANDPKKLIRQLELRARRVGTLASHLKDIETTLSAQSVTAAFEARTEGNRKSEEARRLREATFPTDMLAGTGSDSWTELWDAARRFSQEHAYPGQAFPVVENGAFCVLCQQDLDHAATNRLRQFEEFVASTTERELREVRETFSQIRGSFAALKTTTEATNETLQEIRIEHEAVAESISAALSTNEERRRTVVLALTEGKNLPEDCPAPMSAVYHADAFAAQLRARINTLLTDATDDTRKQLAAEAEELRARKLLGEYEQSVLNEIDRKKKIAAYGQCINDTKTKAITQKSTAVTKIAVSQRLKQCFKRELARLDFRHVEVELKEAGGADGILYHKLVLTRAPGVELPKVVSEGEQRCLSVAAFFAELSTADDLSGIVFDDPVSSLDYRWREGVARRLVEEAKTRQVIVFTHDVVFLLRLKALAEERGVDQLDQHVRQLPMGAGVCAEELPWVAMPIKKKIGSLKKRLQDADSLFRAGDLDAYDDQARLLYGLLREAWERAIEEVLLGGIVERYRPGVQTRQIGEIADINAEDCQTIDLAMTKTSEWLAGHDQAAAARAPLPEPREMRTDIATLESWVAKIRSRRQ